MYRSVSREFTPSECHTKRESIMTCHIKNGHVEQGMKHKSYFITFYKFLVTATRETFKIRK